MSFNFSFRFAEDTKDILNLERFLLKQELNYPNYGDWVFRAKQELLSGYKKSILAFSDGFLVGNLIYQPHKDLPRVRELKNLRVHPKLRERYFGAFMLKQAEKENQNEYDAIICDTRTDRIQIVNLLKNFGYETLLKIPLYDSNIEDMIMIKKFERTPTGFFGSVKNKF